MGRVSLAIALIVVLVLAGLGLNFYQLYMVAQNIKIEEVKISSIMLEGVNPLLFDYYPDKVIFMFTVTIDNPSEYSLTIEKLTYKVYIEEQYFGEGEKENIHIPSKTKTQINLTLQSKTQNLLKIVEKILKTKEKTINYQINGTITIPVKIYNLKIFNINYPYNQKGTYKITLI